MKHTLVLAILLFSSAALIAADPKPNIILILADDLGFGDVSAFNPKSKITTANIDQLAAGGVRFADAHAGGSVCVPSRYALLTGRFAARTTLQSRHGPVIEHKRMTIASLLKVNGYKTAMVGKWHLGFHTLPKTSRTQFDYSTPLRGGPMDRQDRARCGMHADHRVLGCLCDLCGTRRQTEDA